MLRNPDANLFLPSENEWYKAAYYDPVTASSFEFPAGFDERIMCTALTAAPYSENRFGGIGGVTDARSRSRDSPRFSDAHPANAACGGPGARPDARHSSPGNLGSTPGRNVKVPSARAIVAN